MLPFRRALLAEPNVPTDEPIAKSSDKSTNIETLEDSLLKLNFYTSTGFGQNTTSTFGQAKPFGAAPTTTTGGLFGNNNNTATSGGFGGFGANNNAASTTTGFGTPAATTGLFGASKPTTGFGATTTGGLFGGGGGNTATSTGFGATASTTPATGGFGATAGALQPPMNGTSNPSFEPYVEKDVATNAMNHFQTIAFMPAYQKFSLEELRLQDYAQNRKVASGPTTTGFGATGGFGTFGQTQPQPTGFGQTQPAASTGLFGASNTGTTAFGQTPASTGFGSTATTGGLFGQTKPATTGLFGNSTATTTTPAAGGLFGNSTGGFGATNTATTGGFGQTASTGTGLFGQNNNQPKPATGFSFGNTASTTGGGFGQPQQNTGTGFGQAAAPATGTGLFGQQQSTTGFGQPAAAATSSPFGGFGAAQAQPQSTGFGAGGFGAQAAQTPNKPFGGFGSTTPAAAPSGGLFGNTQQNTQTNTGGGLFGNKFGTPATNTGTGLFGNSSATPASTGTGLFGASATPSTGTGLFGNQNQNQGSTGLFGNSAAKPATGGLFGATQTNNTSGGLFGGMNNNNNTQANSLFGQQNSNQNNTGLNNGGMFGSNQGFMGNNSMQNNNQMQQSTSLNSSLMDQRPYGNLLLDMSQMSNASPGPIATPLSASTQKKKNAMIPHHKIAPRQPALTPRLSQPFSRSISPFASGSQMGGSLGRSFSGNSSRLGLGGSMFDATGDESVLQSSAFSPSNANRSANLKKLVIDRKLRDTDLFSNSSDIKTITDSPANQTRNPLKKTVSFDTSSMSRQSDSTNNTPNKTPRADNRTSPNNEFGFLRSATRRPSEDTQPINNGSSTPPSSSPETPPAQEAQATPEKEEIQVNSEGLKHGEYWMVPTAAKLGTIPREKLSSVPSLKVGRRGYGQISFDQPVDLSGLNSLDEVCGGVITFGDRVCTVYPPGWTKPAPGNGLNIPATITLEDCYPTAREDKKPIRDVDHPRYQFHLKRLKSVPDTEFIDYLVQEGIWVFKVKHFTAYGLFDENDEMEEDDEQGKTPTSTSTYEADDTINSRTDESREDSFYSEDASYDENVEDTFDFKRNPDLRSSTQMHSDSDMYEDDVDADATIDESSMLPSEEDSAADSSDTASEDDLTEVMSPNNEAVTIRDDEGQLMLADLSQISSRSATPEPKLGLGKDWTEQLGQTISPIKRTVRFANGTPSKKGLNLTGPLDLAQEFFVAEGDFEV